MHRPIKELTYRPSATAFVRAEVAYKADIGGEVLNKARTLLRSGESKAPLLHLVSRASELLDDIDEMLVALNPARDPPPFATVATLHRQLEHIQSAITAQRRARPSGSKSAGRQ